MQDPYFQLKATPGEKVYAEYDEEFSTWAVFGGDSGFCYAQTDTKEQAEELTNKLNKG